MYGTRKYLGSKSGVGSRTGKRQAGRSSNCSREVVSPKERNLSYIAPSLDTWWTYPRELAMPKRMLNTLVQEGKARLGEACIFGAKHRMCSVGYPITEMDDECCGDQ